MRIFLAILITLVALSPCWADGVSIWALSEDGSQKDASVTGRIGYEVDSIEPFIGFTARPETDFPQLWSLGVIYHLPDLVEEDSPIPWLPEILLTFVNGDVIARPYIGGQASWNVMEEDAGFSGALMGLTIKTTDASPMSFVAEVQKNSTFGDLGNVSGDYRLSLGVRYLF